MSHAGAAVPCQLTSFQRIALGSRVLLLVLPGEKLRVMGSGLSPNGLPFSEEGVLSLALLDKWDPEP